MNKEEFLTFMLGLVVMFCAVVPWGVGAITILRWVFE